MYRKFEKVVIGLLVHVTPSNFFRRIVRSEALVLNSCFFAKQPFYGNYSTLDSHQTLYFVTLLPTRQLISNGFQDLDKVYSFQISVLFFGSGDKSNVVSVTHQEESL